MERGAVSRSAFAWSAKTGLAGAETLEPAILLDKDGTLVEDVPFNTDPALIRPAPGASEALRLLGALGLPIFVVSNQSGVALGRFPIDALDGVEIALHEMFETHGATLTEFYFCPHHPQGTEPAYARACLCRKPSPGLLLRAACEHRLDLRRSWFVGDILDDVEAGRRAGCKTVLLDNGNETEWRTSAWRQPDFKAADLHDAALRIADHGRFAWAGQ